MLYYTEKERERKAVLLICEKIRDIRAIRG